MKCPVCDKEHNALLCPACGFDASRDYAQYPTFGPVGPVQSAATRRRERYQRDQEKVEQISALLASLLAVRYLKLIEEDPYVRGANLRLQALSKELRRVKSDSVRSHSRSQELLADLTATRTETERLSTEQRLYETERRTLLRANDNLKKQVNSLSESLKQSEEWRVASSRETGAKVVEIRELKKTIAKLEADLAAERNKGVLGRLFNR